MTTAEATAAPTARRPLLGRAAIVTGSGSGIGEGVARRLAAGGANVVVCDISSERAESVAADLRRQGVQSIVTNVNVADPAAVNNMVDQVVDRWGRLDIYINNAGVGGDEALRNITQEKWRQVMAVNLDGVFHGCQAAAAAMRATGFGRIVNISSRAWLGWWGQTTYSASKGGVVSMTRALALELARSGITVNAIAPGLINTRAAASVAPEVLENLLVAQPTRTLGDPSDVAHLAAFLVDDRARNITGQVIYTCGGKSIFAMPARR
jgi:3-oxoacyl-[acyl-carrier protein] reductase